jgi:hypothetical protein
MAAPADVRSTPDFCPTAAFSCTGSSCQGQTFPPRRSRCCAWSELTCLWPSGQCERLLKSLHGQAAQHFAARVSQWPAARSRASRSLKLSSWV